MYSRIAIECPKTNIRLPPSHVTVMVPPPGDTAPNKHMWHDSIASAHNIWKPDSLVQNLARSSSRTSMARLPCGAPMTNSLLTQSEHDVYQFTYSGCALMSHWKKGKSPGAAPDAVPAGALSKTTA